MSKKSKPFGLGNKSDAPTGDERIEASLVAQGASMADLAQVEVMLAIYPRNSVQLQIKVKEKLGCDRKKAKALIRAAQLFRRERLKAAEGEGESRADELIGKLDLVVSNAFEQFDKFREARPDLAGPYLDQARKAIMDMATIDGQVLKGRFAELAGMAAGARSRQLEGGVLTAEEREQELQDDMMVVLSKMREVDAERDAEREASGVKGRGIFSVPSDRRVDP